MKNDYYTYELGHLYETQGYYEKAMVHYRALQSTDPDDTKITEAVKRIEDVLGEKTEDPESQTDEKQASSALFERWASLVVMKQRVALLKNALETSPIDG